MEDQKPIEIKLEESPATPPPNIGVGAGKRFALVLFLLLFLIFTGGILWFFTLSSASPIGAGWFLFSFAAGLSMIVLPCTLPLAFVIVPLSMGKGIKRGFLIGGAFSLGIALTLSLYGILAAFLGEVAIGALGAPLEVVKNWLYFIAGIATYLFALGELGLINFRMPSYSGAHPGFIQRGGDVFKAFLLGLFLGNIGVGCPHPATPLILTRIAAAGDTFYGWLLFFTHAIGRVVPLMILAVLGIIGVNALSWVIARKERIAKATGWAMVFVAGFILILGLFSHDWWVYSGSHSLLEEITKEERFLEIISNRLETESPHIHGFSELEGKTGLFGLPLELGSWVLLFLWIIPMFWYYFKFKREKLIFWFFIILSLLLGLTFLHTIPHWFLEKSSMSKAELSVEVDIVPRDLLEIGKPILFDILIKDKTGAGLIKTLNYSHERLIHVVIIHEDLEFFKHTHPEDLAVITEKMLQDGKFPLEFEFPKNGKYIFAVDFKHGEHNVAFTKTFEVGGRPPSILKKDFSKYKSFDDLNAFIESDPLEIATGKNIHIKYHFEKDGKSVTDFESYLAAPMHFSIVSLDLATFAHTHGTLFLENGENNHGAQGPNIFPHVLAHGTGEGEIEDSREQKDDNLPDNFGPDIFLSHTFQHPGLYVIFGEIKHKDKIILTNFMVEVVSGKSNIFEANHH
ncbi:MAG: cytochrome c biogenesis CcdA family protein [Patescibacteria group bacterium]